MSEANKVVGCSYVAKPTGRVNPQAGVEAVKVEEQGDCPGLLKSLWEGLSRVLDGVEKKPTNLDRSDENKVGKSSHRW